MTPVSRLVRAANWKYAFGEVLLIVIGISLALAIDAWREDLSDRIAEREYIDQLIRDLNSTEELMASVAEGNAVADEAAVRLFELFRDNVSVDTQELRRLLWNSSSFDNPVPVLGTAEALVATGDLRLIQDSGVRSRVTQYLSHTRDYWLGTLYTSESRFHESVDNISRIAARFGIVPARQTTANGEREAPDVDGFLNHPDAFVETQLLGLQRRELAAYRNETAADAAELRRHLEAYMQRE